MENTKIGLKKRVLEIISLYKNGISFDIFEKLIIHCMDGYSNERSQYGNNLNIEEWGELFAKPFVEINLEGSQLKLFFEYMVNNHKKYFGRYQNNFTVNKSIEVDRKRKELFEFEQIVFMTCEEI